MLQKVSSFFFGDSESSSPPPQEETAPSQEIDRLGAGSKPELVSDRLSDEDEGKEDKPLLQETDMNDEWIMVDIVVPSKPNTRHKGSPEWRGSTEDLRTSCWLMEPPPCFLMPGRPEEVVISPRENLLIEHPSMSIYSHWGHSSNWYYHRYPEHLTRVLERLRGQQQRTKEAPPVPTTATPAATSRCTLVASNARALTEVQKARETAPAAQQARWQRDQRRLKASCSQAQNRGYQKTAKRPHRKDRHWRRQSGANNNRCSYLRL